MINMIVTLEDIKYFIVNRAFNNGLAINIPKEKVIDIFGYPPNHQPQKGKSQEIMGYGALNIYLHFQKVVGFSINLHANYLNNLILEPMFKYEIIQHINNMKIKINKEFSLDDICYIFIDDVQIGFSQNKLCYIAQGIMS